MLVTKLRQHEARTGATGLCIPSIASELKRVTCVAMSSLRSSCQDPACRKPAEAQAGDTALGLCVLR